MVDGGSLLALRDMTDEGRANMEEWDRESEQKGGVGEGGDRAERL